MDSYFDLIDRRDKESSSDILKESPKKISDSRRIISSKTLRRKEERGFLVLEIIDIGIRMKNSGHANLFQPFFQAKTDAKYQSTGLALWIIKQLINSMNGQIFVKSKFRYGSTFKVVIHMTICQNQSLPSSSKCQILASSNYFDKYFLFSPKVVPNNIQSKANLRKYLLIANKKRKELILIKDLFNNPNSYYKFNQEFFTFYYDRALKLMKQEQEQVNTIILFTSNLFLSSLYFVHQIREKEIRNCSLRISILVVGNKEVHNHLEDYLKLGLNNFTFDIFNTKEIDIQFKKMIKQEIM